jgi:hypothetical protein
MTGGMGSEATLGRRRSSARRDRPDRTQRLCCCPTWSSRPTASRCPAHAWRRVEEFVMANNFCDGYYNINELGQARFCERGAHGAQRAAACADKPRRSCADRSWSRAAHTSCPIAALAAPDALCTDGAWSKWPSRFNGRRSKLDGTRGKAGAAHPSARTSAQSTGAAWPTPPCADAGSCTACPRKAAAFRSKKTAALFYMT